MTIATARAMTDSSGFSAPMRTAPRFDLHRMPVGYCNSISSIGDCAGRSVNGTRSVPVLHSRVDAPALAGRGRSCRESHATLASCCDVASASSLPSSDPSTSSPFASAP